MTTHLSQYFYSKNQRAEVGFATSFFSLWQQINIFHVQAASFQWEIPEWQQRDRGAGQMDGGSGAGGLDRQMLPPRPSPPLWVPLFCGFAWGSCSGSGSSASSAPGACVSLSPSVCWCLTSREPSPALPWRARCLLQAGPACLGRGSAGASGGMLTARISWDGRGRRRTGLSLYTCPLGAHLVLVQGKAAFGRVRQLCACLCARAGRGAIPRRDSVPKNPCFGQGLRSVLPELVQSPM